MIRRGQIDAQAYGSLSKEEGRGASDIVDQGIGVAEARYISS